MNRILIVGTGLIGASIGLALRAAGFSGHIDGWNRSAQGLRNALEMGAVDEGVCSQDNEADALRLTQQADVIMLAQPVLAIKDWMERLAGVVHAGQLVTDAGSTKLEITDLAAKYYGGEGQAAFLPGHPMAGKESGGAKLAEADLFRGAMWLFTPAKPQSSELEKIWREWVVRMGARTMDLDARRHDELVAWVSHLPQMLSTALAALLEDEFGQDEAIAAIGGRALRETTRLGASPYSMWRDIALTNTKPIARTLDALEQRLAHLRENLRNTGLRDEFDLANRFRSRR